MFFLSPHLVKINHRYCSSRLLCLVISTKHARGCVHHQALYGAQQHHAPRQHDAPPSTIQYEESSSHTPRFMYHKGAEYRKALYGAKPPHAPRKRGAPSNTIQYEESSYHAPPITKWHPTGSCTARVRCIVKATCKHQAATTHGHA